MRKVVVALFIAIAVLPGVARAQFCPGVTPWVFQDVPSSDPFCGYITYMAKAGITTGCLVIDASNRLYCPNDLVTRWQMAAFMGRFRDDLFPLGCPTGSVMKWDGNAWDCASDNVGVTSAGTVTSIAAGTGLQAIPNPITVSGGIGIASTYQLPQGCAAGQIPKWAGATWTCAADAFGTGTLTSLGQGAGIELTPNPITSTGVIAVAAGGITSTALANNAVTTSKITDANVTFPKLAATGCAHGQVLKYMNGTWGCAADNEAIATTLSASFVRKRDTTLGARDFTGQQNLCATDPIAAADYPRSALVRGMVNLFAPTGSMSIEARVVYSTDGGTTWISPATGDGFAYGALYNGLSPPNDISLHPINVIALNMGTSYRFALAATRTGGTGQVANVYCENLVQMLIPSGVGLLSTAGIAPHGSGKRDEVLHEPSQAKDAELAVLQREVADLRRLVDALTARTPPEWPVVPMR